MTQNFYKKHFENKPVKTGLIIFTILFVMAWYIRGVEYFNLENIFYILLSSTFYGSFVCYGNNQIEKILLRHDDLEEITQWLVSQDYNQIKVSGNKTTFKKSNYNWFTNGNEKITIKKLPYYLELNAPKSMIALLTESFQKAF